MFLKYKFQTGFNTCAITILLSNIIVYLHLGGFSQHSHDQQPEKCK